MLLDQHPGYVTWDQFLGNRRQLDDNRSLARGRPSWGRLRGAIALAGDCFVWLLWPTDEHPETLAMACC